MAKAKPKWPRCFEDKNTPSRGAVWVFWSPRVGAFYAPDVPIALDPVLSLKYCEQDKGLREIAFRTARRLNKSIPRERP